GCRLAMPQAAPRERVGSAAPVRAADGDRVGRSRVPAVLEQDRPKRAQERAREGRGRGRSLGQHLADAGEGGQCPPDRGGARAPEAERAACRAGRGGPGGLARHGDVRQPRPEHREG
ncbi:MAG: hypothetical protein ACK559_34835, partial [bacterium]